MKINGKEVKLQFDFGTMRILKRDFGIDYLKEAYLMSEKAEKGELEDEGRNYELTALLLIAAAKRAGCEVTEEDIDGLKPMEFVELEVELAKHMMDFQPEQSKEKPKRKNQKRQS